MTNKPIGTSDPREVLTIMTRWNLYYDYRVHSTQKSDGLLVSIEWHKDGSFHLYASSNHSVILDTDHATLSELLNTHIFDISKFYRCPRASDDE